jgi:NO-binding membrane sensor protein with MHYT domain
MLPERHDPVLVVLSYLVATLGSITALRLGARVGARGGRLRVRWLIGGALAQGMGIWGMHFTGMLAFRLPVPIDYDVPLMLLSYVVAAAGAALALSFTQRRRIGTPLMLAGALAIGAGISGLHFMDMAAMRMAARAVYSPPLAVLSIVIACVFGLLSLRIGRQHQRDDPRRPRRHLWLGGAVMGLAIVGQHYTGMAAADFIPAPDSRPHAMWRAIPGTELPELVLVSTIAILGVALVAATADRRRGAQSVLSQRLLAAQENERRRIARGLHEDLGQLLTAVRLNLQRLAPSPGDVAVVADSVSLVDDALGRVRTLSVELRPPVLDDLGLGAAVSWYAKRSGERGGYEVEVDNSLGATRLPEAIETAGFRIVQQALTNISRHASASRVRITLDRGPREVRLVIADDGSGFDVVAARMRAESGESLGLLDMREMATLAGGSLTLASAPGRGSTVRARFPLED